MSRSFPHLVLAAALALLAAPDCQTSGGSEEKESGADTARRLLDGADIDPQELLEAAERLRDREFDERPALRVASQPFERDRATSKAPPSDGLPKALFGLSEDRHRLRSPLTSVARYEHEQHRIRFHRGDASQRRLRIALLAAMVRALDTQHFDPVPRATTRDGRLARFAATEADVMLVVAAYLYEQRTGESGSGLEMIAARPELSLQLEGLTPLLQRRSNSEEAPVKSRAELQARTVAFGLREGLSLAAALYRSAGWSGVELLYEMSPSSTADVVRPDRWMTGEGLGEWKWPEAPSGSDAYETTHSGRVGPALTSIWIAQSFRPELARTIYSGWRSDSFRFRRPSGTSGDANSKLETDAWRFEWLQQWDTPTSARQIAEACRAVLRLAHGPPREGPVQWNVFRKGLNVGLVVRKRDGDEERDANDRATYLLQSEPGFQPREGLPLSFRPTRTEVFRRDVESAAVEDGTWRDPAAKIRATVAPLESWTFRLSRTLPLRWFAKKDDGATIQLTTELADPLGPTFATETYRRNLRESFSKPLEKPEFDGPTTDEAPVSPTLVFSVSGQKAKSQWTIKAWQFTRGDVITTLSLQAPSSTFSNYTDTAETIVDSIETTGAPPGPGSDKESGGSGSIEYEIEE